MESRTNRAPTEGWGSRPCIDLGRIPSMTELMAKAVANSFVLTLSFALFLVFLIGSYDYVRNVEDNKCEMTFMFEYPEFIRIKLENEMDKKHPNYGLYAYAEGKFGIPAKRHKFTGIPVLFVPGNAGSYKQVRSFASVALRKWLDSKTPYHFDFFTLDFNEELSGLYGYVLSTQSKYLVAAIERIQSFYDEYHSVILIGHSMGGIVSKTLKENEEPLSKLIISLSTPHTRPILIFDPDQDLFYYQLSRNWTTGKAKLERDVTLVSVGGGDRDILVPEGFTKWGRHLDIHTTTTAIPGVWASTDHLCIVWCKQFVFSVVRSLFDLVEYRQPNGFYALTDDSELRKKILDYHLIKKSSGKSYHNAHRDTELGKPPTTGWNELLTHNYCSAPSRSTTYLMFPVQIIKEKLRHGNPNDYKIMILTTNTGAKNWILGCTSQLITDGTRHCSTADNLSKYGEMIPHFRRRRKVIHLKYSDISKYSHLIVRMDPFNLKSCVNLEIYNEKDQSNELSTKFETENRIFHNLTFPLNTGIFSKFLGWKVLVNTGNESSCARDQNSLAIFQHGQFKVYRYPRNETLVARFSDWNVTSANVQLYLEPTCKYTVQVRLASVETCGQIFRTYFRLLPSFFGSIVLMSLYFQKNAKDWSNFHRVLISNACQLTIIPGFVVSILLSILPNDWPHMLDGPEYFVILPMFCYLVAYSIVLFVATGAWYLIIGFGNAVHAVFLRMVTTRFAKWTNLRIPMPDQVADIAIDFTMEKFPIIISVLLISMTLTTCGGFGLFAGLWFFMIKLFKMYEDLLADFWRGKIRNVAEGLSPLNFQFSCAMMWFYITAINLPSLIHWVKSFTYENAIQWDISMYVALMVLPIIGVLWQDHVPNFNSSLWRLHRFVFYAMGLAIVVWGTFRLYISGFIVTMVLLTTAMCQLISSIPILKEGDEPSQSKPYQNEQVDASASASESEDSLEEDTPVKSSYQRAFEREKESIKRSSHSQSASDNDQANQADLENEDGSSSTGEESSESSETSESRQLRSRSKSRSMEKASESEVQNTPTFSENETDEINAEPNAQDETNTYSNQSKENSPKVDKETSEIKKKTDN